MKNSIGIKNESTLHRTLKFRYVGTGGKTEEIIEGFVADGVCESGEIIEVQTGNFAPLVKKLGQFSKLAKVRIIHPIAVTKIIETYSNDGSLISRRKSPKRGSVWSIFDVLIYTPELPLTKNVVIEVVLADITEKRVKIGKRGKRRRETSVFDKELSVWHEKILFAKKADYLRFIPFGKGEKFTTSGFAKKAEINIDMARKAVYVLVKMNVVKRIGKDKQAWVYAR